MRSPVPRKRTILTLVLAGSLIGAAVALPAIAAPTKKLYTPTLTPSSSGGGVTQAYTFSIMNAPSSSQSLGSANIAVPSGFSVSSTPAPSVSVPGGKAWTAALSGSTIQLRSGPTSANGIFPGQTVSVTFTATAPCASGAYSWISQVKQSNDFLGNNNDFSLAPSVHHPEVTVSGACHGAPAAVAFSVQPTDAVAGDPITPAVEVQVTDAFADPVPAASVTITIGSGSGTLSGTTTASTDSGGIASFGTLEIDTAGAFTLTATVGALTADSESFTIFAGTIECSDVISGSGGGTDVTITAAPSGDGCEPGTSKPYTLSTTAREIDFVTSGEDPVEFTVSINAWSPEPVANPVPASIVSPPEGGEPGVWCDLAGSEPVMPAGHSWCLVSQSTGLVNGDGDETLMQVTEEWLLIADARIGRG